METEIDRRFMFVRTGYSYRVGEIEGALGLAQLERTDEIMSMRRRNAMKLMEGLEKHEGILRLPRHPADFEHTYMMFPIVLKPGSGVGKEGFVRFLESRNIETRPMLTLLSQPAYVRMFGDLWRSYPNADYISKNGFYIGCHHGLGDNELDYMVDAISGYLSA
jgi:dTDP-4-amino-4,6-dideoxygalactose transaminase